MPYQTGIKASIICSSDPVIKKLFSSLLQSIETYKNEEAAAKIGSDSKGKQVSGLKPGKVITFLMDIYTHTTLYLLILISFCFP